MIRKEFFRTHQDELLNEWATLSRQVCPAASDKSLAAIRNHLPQLLDAFHAALDSQPKSGTFELSKIHGRQRFSFTNYTLSQVLTEYGLLKRVLSVALNADTALEYEDFQFINHFFDEAANIAATEFARLREEELKRYTSDLETMNEDLERFAAVAAHDLRAPAATIIGFSELLQEERQLNQASRNSVDTIHRTAHRIIALVDQLLEYSKIGKASQKTDRVALRQIVENALENLAANIADSKADIHITPHLPVISGDRVLLTQLFQNLISNSLKFRAPDRPLIVQVLSEEQDGFHVVSVKDNGLGFDPSLEKEIFEPFRRGKNSRKIHGSGLGLATVKKVMDLHHGSIRAASRPNEGAVFSLRFEKIQAEPSGDSPSETDSRL